MDWPADKSCQVPGICTLASMHRFCLIPLSSAVILESLKSLFHRRLWRLRTVLLLLSQASFLSSLCHECRNGLARVRMGSVLTIANSQCKCNLQANFKRLKMERECEGGASKTLTIRVGFL